jgi:hypothetical protein
LGRANRTSARSAKTDQIHLAGVDRIVHGLAASETAGDHDRHLSDLADFGGKLDEKSFPFYGAFCTAVFAFVLEREAEDLRLFD